MIKLKIHELGLLMTNLVDYYSSLIKENPKRVLDYTPAVREAVRIIFFEPVKVTPSTELNDDGIEMLENALIAAMDRTDNVRNQTRAKAIERLRASRWEIHVELTQEEIDLFISDLKDMYREQKDPIIKKLRKPVIQLNSADVETLTETLLLSLAMSHCYSGVVVQSTKADVHREKLLKLFSYGQIREYDAR